MDENNNINNSQADPTSNIPPEKSDKTPLFKDKFSHPIVYKAGFKEKLSVLLSFKNKFNLQSIKKLKNKKVLIIILLIIFIAAAAFATRQKKRSIIRNQESPLITSQDDGFKKLIIPERDQPFFKLKTKEARKFGILPKEEFVLETLQPVTASFVASIIDNPDKYTIEQEGEKEIIIKNRDLLDLDEPISISLSTDGESVGGYTFDRDYSWAFQSQGKFRVVSTIPGNEKTKVPVNTGIEITFSQDGFKDPVNFIEIEPQIEFRTEIVDETFVIVPLQNLDYETVYTVKLRKGLNLSSRNDPLADDFVFSFQTQELVKPGKIKPWISINDNFVQTSPLEPFITKVSTSGWNDDMKVNVKVYKFRDSLDFVKTREEYDEAIKDWREYYPKRYSFSEGLPEVYSEDVSVQEQDKLKYLQLSQNLDPGYYILEFRVDNELVSHQIWYQSSEIASYISLGREDIIVWANDLAAKAPAQNVLVRSVSTGGTWTTNGDGVAKFPSAMEYFNEDNDYFVLESTSGQSVVLPVQSQKGNVGPGETTDSDYWSYLYTEKYYYHGNDIVNIWGVIKDRDTGSIPNTKLTLSFSGEDVYSESLNPSVNGAFIAKIPLNEAPNGWYTLKLITGNTTVESVYFTVQEFVKPDMKIEIAADKKAIFTDEEVVFDINTKFFDETPGSNIELNIHESRSGKKTKLKTDDNGSIKYTYKPSYSEGSSYPRYDGIAAIPALTQESIIEGNGSIRVYGPKIMMSTKRDQTTDKASFTATINKVDLTNINNGTSNDPKGAPVQGKEVSVKVVENWTERVETGTAYNFIEKITYKTYRYDSKSETKSETILTTNEAGQISQVFNMTEGRSYTVTLIAKDDDGKKVKKELYFYASKWYGSPSYYFGEGEDTNIYLDLAFGRDTNIYSTGEDVYVKLTQQNDDYKVEEGDKFLFTKSQRGRQDFFIEGVPQFSFKFEEKDVPNTYVSAVTFNGRFYKRANGVCRREWKCSGGGYGYYYYDYYGLNNFKGITISHKTEDSKLDIEIVTSKPKYEPGERVSLEAVVTKDGSPVADAAVNLVMVDAALAAIGGVREPSVLTSIHQNVPHQIYYVYTTHEPIIPDIDNVEMGGGGGGDRDLFKDTAAFYQTQSDANGKAVFEFDLPDNITTWAIYTQAITANLDAGQAESSIIATKDFFVTSKFPRSLLVDDSSYVSANSFGTALTSDSAINYTVLFNEDGKEIERLEKEDKAFVENDFKIPQLNEGNYDVVVRGKFGQKEDGIRLPLDVFKSRIKQEFSVKHSVNEGENVSNLITDEYYKDEPVLLVVSDQGKGKFFYNLVNYCYSSWSNRLERKIVSKRSDALLRDKFDYDKCYVSEPKFSEFQGCDGGLSQVVWGGSFLDSSLWAVIVAPDEFNKEDLIKYFEGQYKDSHGSKLQKIQSGWALSLLGESKLRELKGMVSSVISFNEKVNLGLALAQLKDKETARELLLDILADYAYELNPYIRIDSKQDRGAPQEDFVVETSKTLLLGELVDDKYNDAMYEYIDDYRGNLENYLIDLSEIEYIDTAIANLPDSDTVYTIRSSSGEVNETLDRGRSMNYELNANDIGNFNFTLTEGKADLLAKYMVGVDVLRDKKKDGRISIKRTFSEAKQDDGVIKPGDIVKISLELTMDIDNAPKGSYSVKDSLPSGLIYLGNPAAFGLTGGDYARQSINNTVTFYTYNSSFVFKDGKATITYYAKASAVGSFKAEPAVFQSEKELTVFTMTDTDTLVVE